MPRHTPVSLLVTLGCAALLALAVTTGRPWDEASFGSANAAPAPKPAPTTQSSDDPRARLIVSDEPPPPPVPAPAATPTPTPAPVPHFRHGAHSRRSSPLHLRDRPDGTPSIRLGLGLVMTVLEAGTSWTKVETAGPIRVAGWVPSVVLGLRVQKNTALYGAPGGKPIGEVAMGQLVHVVRTQGAYALARLMGHLPLDVWIQKADLGIGPTTYGRLKGTFPGGSAMVVSPGPIHASAEGPRVGDIRDEGRVYRVRVAGRWSQLAMFDYSRLEIQAWVPTTRLRWGGYPSYGSGYHTANCTVGSAGSHTALSDLMAYAAQDDAWPTIRLQRGARFNVSQTSAGWVRISVSGCISFVAFAEDRPGDWAPSHLVPQ